jgi:peptide-methionine (S)-S-oxide reductase
MNKFAGVYMKQILFFLMLLTSFTLQAKSQKAYFAGGCFWCMESDFEKLDGVSEVISGFTGGDSTNPTYKGDHKGHYEAVEVIYDNEKVTYKKLLDYYWRHIDPFDPEGQFCDKGDAYKTAVFPSDEKEMKLAQESLVWVKKKFPKQTVTTKILKLKSFYPIKGKESYHQNYYKNNPIRYKYYRWNCGRDQRVKEIWGE